MNEYIEREAVMKTVRNGSLICVTLADTSFCNGLTKLQQNKTQNKGRLK